MGGVGDGHVAGPDPGVVGDEPPVETHPDPFQVGGDVDHPADRGRVDGVVVGVDADVVVAAQPDLVRQPTVQRDRRQRQHRCPVGVDQIDRAGLDRAHHPPVRPVEPVGELGVEVGRRGEAAAGHERGLEEPVAPLDHTLGLRVVRLELMHAWWPTCRRTRRHPAASRPRRPMPDSLSQISRRGTRPSCSISAHDPNSRSGGLARRDHPAADEPRVRRRRSPAPATTPSCRPRAGSASAGTTGRTAPHHPAPTSAGPPDPGGDAPDAAGPRCRGTTSVDPVQPTRSASTVAGMSGISASNARTRASNGVNDVGSTGARSYFGGAVRGHRLDHRVPRDPQPLSDPRLRHPLRRQPPDQRPVLQSDHTPIVECSLFDRRYCSVFDRHRQ